MNFTDPPTQKTFTMQGGGSNSVTANGDEIIKVAVTVDGKLQTFELKHCSASEIFIDSIMHHKNDKLIS